MALVFLLSLATLILGWAAREASAAAEGKAQEAVARAVYQACFRK